MSSQGLSIAQTARKLGVSTRTVRRYIKAGKIKAELVIGQFGEEYRILELPPELYQVGTEGETPTPSQHPGQSLGQAIDIIRELQEKNLALAAQLGAATERIRNLENQVKLLTAPKLPWWKRLLFRRAG
jgi:MerR family copper efflux transcriptional regulator